MRKSATQILILVIPVGLGCVDPADVTLPADTLPLVIEGLVTDQDGPDTVKVTKAYPVDGNYHSRIGVTGAQIAIADDEGNIDVLTDIGRGYYVTNTLVGTIGHTYTLSGTLPGGTRFESTAERMAPAGSIDSIYYEFIISRDSKTGASEAGFNIYTNSHIETGSSMRLQWRFRGTYQYTTDPSLIVTPMPLPCAQGCQCCVCFATEHETSPILSNSRFEGTTDFQRTFIQYIPVNAFTFNDRYRVDVEQMEISQPVYDFYFGIRRQIQNASSLFQPPFFEVSGNLTTIDGPKVIGVFSAAAVTRRHFYIKKSEVPVVLNSQPIAADCRVAVPHATTTVPPYWD